MIIKTKYGTEVEYAGPFVLNHVYVIWKNRKVDVQIDDLDEESQELVKQKIYEDQYRTISPAPDSTNFKN